MTATFEELYNSACGIVGQTYYDTEKEFDDALAELEDNPDFSLLGIFDMTQDADEELQEAGFTLDQITKMSLNRYGNCIETLKGPDTDYFVFVGGALAMNLLTDSGLASAGLHLRTVREFKGLSRKEAAEHGSVSLSYLQKLETGKAGLPDHAKLKNYCKALGLTVKFNYEIKFINK